MKTASGATLYHKISSLRLRSVKYFLIILTPSLFLLTLIMWQFYRIDHKQIYLEIKTLASHRLDAEQTLIEKEFQIIAGDLLTLAGQNEILHFADSGDQRLLPAMAREYIQYSKSKGIYDQIRFIDQTGQEQVRINFNDGAPAAVPQKDLQNKSSRYYFHKSMQLQRNNIFISPLDLNLELGQIEYPLKPMIRFGTPIFDSKGERKGILLINYQANQLLTRIAAQSNAIYGELMLINADGYWLYSPNKNEAWGFMFAEGKNRVFANSFPEVWAHIHEKEAASLMTKNGFFTFRRVSPLKNLNIQRGDDGDPDNPYTWTIISRVPPEQLLELTAQTKAHFLKLLSLLTLGTILSTLMISWALLKREKAEQAAGLALAEQAQVFDTVEDGIVIMDADLIIRKVNDRFQNLWQIDANAAVGKKGTELVPLPEHLDPDAFQLLLLNQEKTLRFEVAQLRQDGTTIYCQYSAAPLRSGDNRPIGAVGCLHDITAYKEATLALRESNDRFALVVAGTNDGIWDWNITSGDVYFSPRWLAQSGYREGEMAGRIEDWQQRLHPDDLKSVKEVLAKYLNDNEATTYEVEYRFRDKDGFYRWFQSRGAAIRNEEGKPYRMAGSQTDITARKENEEQMLRRAAQDSALAELSGSLLSEHSIEEITESIIAKSKMLTESRFAFAGYIDNETGHLFCPAMINEIMVECKLADKETMFEKCAGLWGWVIENRQAILANDAAKDSRSTGLPEGHIPIQRFLSVPAMINDELVGIVALANSERDYTERDIKTISKIATLFALAIQRKRTDESIHRLLLGTAAVTGERFFATMVEQLAKCLGTRYVLVGEILPESPTEVSGLAFWNGDALGEPFSYSLAATPCEEVHQSGFCLYEKNVAALFPEDQELRTMNVEFYAGIPLLDANGTAIGILCAMHDTPLTKITHINEIFQIFSNRTSGEIERQRTEKALAFAKEAAESANKAKSRFLANMSHELRTPLNAIIGFAAVLQEQHFGPLNAKQLDYTNDIRNGGDHLLNIINDILDLAKIEAGKMPFTMMPAQISHLLEQSLAIIRKTAAQHAIAIDLEIGEEVENLILDIDERKIKQALLNLLTNAIKFTPDRGRITVSASRHEKTLSISITDTGIGISENDRKRIFEPFYQVKNEYRGKTPGTGLGLPLTKTLVEMHKGTLNVKSDGKNKGTCFTISLPIKKSGLAAALLPTEE